MKRSLLSPLLLICLVQVCAQSGKTKGGGAGMGDAGGAKMISGAYFPPRGEWAHRSPEQLGMDPLQLQTAIRFAQDSESKEPRDLELAQAEQFGSEPYDAPVGPMKDRGEPTGIIVYKGYIVAEWGEPSRVDMTHSVTKSFLSTVVGLAVDQGLIHNVMDTVAPYVPPIEVFDPAKPARSPEDIGKPQLLYPFATPHDQ